MIINFDTAFPVDWETEYYTVEKDTKETRYCKCCDNTGKVTIKGETYTCPECYDKWSMKEVSGAYTTYYVGKWRVYSVSKDRYDMRISFEQLNRKTNSQIPLTINKSGFNSMTDWTGRELYASRNEAMQEVKRLNAAEKAKQKEQEESQC